MLTEIVNKIYHVKCREARHGGTQLLCQHWGGRNRSHDLGPAWATYQVPGQPGLHRKTLPKN